MGGVSGAQTRTKSFGISGDFNYTIHEGKLMATGGDEVHGDKVEGNKITVGNISGSGTVNIAGGFITQNIPPSSQEKQQSLQRPSLEVSILFLAADPTDASRLRTGSESREIGEKLKLSKLRD